MRLRLLRCVTYMTMVSGLVGGSTACTVSQDQEVQLGEQNAQQINAQLPLVQDPAINDYINALGNRMAQRTSRSDLAWHFYVVNAAEANAFALPGGFIYVNRGLIDLTSNEAELAGAIGHEIGHVIERHAVKQMQQQEGANVGVTAVCMLTNVCNSTVGRAAIQVGGSAVFARHSRHDEAQADSEAVVNTVRAGIDPRGVPALFERLLETRQRQPMLVEGWFADHPGEESRIQHSRSLIHSLSDAQLQGLETDSPEYHDMRARLDSLGAPPPPRTRDTQQDPAAQDTTTAPSTFPQ
ncbi:MAG: M48 family metallopeptidase [Gemmatimonadaceae bacterium]